MIVIQVGKFLLQVYNRYAQVANEVFDERGQVMPSPTNDIASKAREAGKAMAMDNRKNGEDLKRERAEYRAKGGALATNAYDEGFRAGVKEKH